MKYNLLPKERRKSNLNKNISKIVAVIIIGQIVAGVLIHNNKMNHEAELRTLTNDLQQQQASNKEMQSVLDKNDIFKDLRVKNTYNIKPRVTVNDDGYDKLLAVVYSLVPDGVVLTNAKFDTKQNSFTLIGQTTDYNKIMSMYSNFQQNALSENTSFDNMTYDKENKVINFQITCIIVKAKDTKAAPKTSSSSNTSNTAKPSDTSKSSDGIE